MSICITASLYCQPLFTQFASNLHNHIIIHVNGYFQKVTPGQCQSLFAVACDTLVKHNPQSMLHVNI